MSQSAKTKRPSAKTTARSTSVSTAKAKVKAKPKGRTSPAARASTGSAAARLIDERIQSLGDWRGETLANVRRLIHEADSEIVEDTKWAKASNPLGVPVWSHAGIVCTGEVYKDAVKLTFARGASLDDPGGLFTSSLDGNTRRAIDLREGQEMDAKAFKALIRAAVDENLRARGDRA